MFPEAPTPRKIGDYAVVRRLRTEGAVEVFLARDEGPMGFSREVVLRCVRRDGDDDPVHAAELAREARICARLNHPAIVRVIGFFAERDRVVLALEHVDGVVLSDLLAGRVDPLDDAAIAYVGATVAGALAAAHATTDESGARTPVLHRAVSPDVVLVAHDGAVKLSGFGLAKILDRTPDSAVGRVRGVAGYVAPEQARGEHATERTDLWAVATILHRLYTAGSEANAGLLPVIAGRAPSLVSVRPDLPRELAAAIDAALHDDPARRSIGCAELARWIARVVSLDEGRRALRDALSSAAAPSPPSDGKAPRASGSRRRVRSMQRRASSAKMAVLRAAVGDVGVELEPDESDEPVDRIEVPEIEPAVEIPVARTRTMIGVGPSEPVRSPARPALARAFSSPIEPVVPPVKPAPVAPVPDAIDAEPPIPSAPSRRRVIVAAVVGVAAVLLLAIVLVVTSKTTASPPDAAAPRASASASTKPAVAVASAAASHAKATAKAAAAPAAQASPAPSKAAAQPSSTIPVPPKKPPHGMGWIFVNGPKPGLVFVAGKGRGEPGKLLLAPCGKYYVNLAKTDAKGKWRGWAAKGVTTTIACDGSVTEITFEG